MFNQYLKQEIQKQASMATTLGGLGIGAALGGGAGALAGDGWQDALIGAGIGGALGAGAGYGIPKMFGNKAVANLAQYGAPIGPQLPYQITPNAYKGPMGPTMPYREEVIAASNLGNRIAPASFDFAPVNAVRSTIAGIPSRFIRS